MTTARQKLRQEILDYHQRQKRRKLLDQLMLATGELLTDVKPESGQVDTGKLAKVREIWSQLSQLAG